MNEMPQNRISLLHYFLLFKEAGMVSYTYKNTDKEAKIQSNVC